MDLHFLVEARTPDQQRITPCCAASGERVPGPQWTEGFVSRTRCSVLHAAPQSRDPHFLVEAWTYTSSLRHGPRISSASLRAAQRPGNESARTAMDREIRVPDAV